MVVGGGRGEVVEEGRGVRWWLRGEGWGGGRGGRGEVVAEGGGVRWWQRGRERCELVVGTCDLGGGMRDWGGGGGGEG